MSGLEFVGRAKELAAVATGFDEAVSGRGGVFLVVGESGVGKTRFADQASRQLGQRGASVAFSRCWEGGGDPPYWPWIGVLRALVVSRPDVAADGGPAEAARLFDEPGDGSGVPDQAARFRLYDRLLQRLRSLSAVTPVVIVLDDLHAADASTLRLLEFIAREIRSSRLLILGTTRSTGPLAKIAREATCLPLSPFSAAETAAFLARGYDVVGELASSLHAATAGNPLFLSEMVGLAKQRGELAQAGATRLRIPDTLAEVVNARLLALGDVDRGLLAVAAVTGHEFAVPLLASVAGVPFAEVEPALARAADAGVLEGLADRRWRFRHGLFQEVLYRGLVPERRATLHAVIAETLQRDRCADPGSAPSEIAHHMFEALPVVGIERAIRETLREAERSRRAVAFEHAATRLERALAVLEHSPEPRLECEVLAMLGTVHILAGAEVAGKDACRRSAELARRLHDGQLFANAVLAYGYAVTPAEPDPFLVTLLEEALTALPREDGALRAAVMARLASARQPSGDPELPMVLAREAIAMARRLADPSTLRDVLYAAGGAFTGFAHPSERLSLDDELARLAAACGDRAQELRARARLFFDYLDLGDSDKAEAARQSHQQLAALVNRPGRSWLVPMLRAMQAVLQGRFSDAERLAGEAATTAGQGPWAKRCFGLHRFGLLRAAERHPELMAAEEELAILVRGGPHGDDLEVALRVAVRSRLGDEAETKSLLGRIGEESAVLWADPVVLMWLAEAAAVARDEARARRVYDHLLPRRGTLASWGASGMLSEGPVARGLALCKLAEGQLDHALTLYDEALALARKMTLRPAATRIRLEICELLARRRRPGDREAAAQHLAIARPLADSLPLPGLLGRFASAAAWTSDRTETGAPRLEREGQVWACSWRGHVTRVKHTRGLEMLARLLERPGEEIHVLDLAAADGEGLRPEDAGEVLDDEAVAQYRGRLQELATGIEEADRWNDSHRAARLRAEKEAIQDELKRAAGLGGRRRRAASVSERARSNVTRRLRGAIQRIGEGDRELGRHLDESVVTGNFCCYRREKT